MNPNGRHFLGAHRDSVTLHAIYTDVIERRDDLPLRMTCFPRILPEAHPFEMVSWVSKLDYTIYRRLVPEAIKMGRTVPSRDSLIDDVQLQNKQLADLCKQAEALRHAARLLCEYLTERIQHTRTLLQFQGPSDRRKKPRG
jgi:hypothetical protein